MSRDSNGNYSLPAGNPVTSGDTVSSTWANTTLADIASEMTSSLERSGKGGMTGPFKAAAGTVGAPGISFSAETTSGFYRAGSNDIRGSIAGSDIFRFNASGLQVYVGASWEDILTTGATIDAATLDGNAAAAFAAASHTHATTDVTGLEEFVEDTIGAALVEGANITITYDDGAGTITIAAAGGSSPASIDDIGDVTISAVASGEVLMWNGSAWINRTLAEASIAAASHNHTGTYEPADAAIVKSDEAETITANWDFTGQVTFDKVYTPPVADTISAGTLTIDTDDSNVFTVTMNANVTTLNLSNADQGQTINILFTQDGTGSRTITWPASFKWPSGTAGVLSTAAGSIDLLVATYIGTTWYASLLNDFQTP